MLDLTIHTLRLGDNLVDNAFSYLIKQTSEFFLSEARMLFLMISKYMLYVRD